MAGLAAVAAVACGLLLAAPQLGPAAFWVGAAVWGIGGLGFGAVSMLAVMAEADEAKTGRASGMVVFWFSLGFSLAPPLFGWSVELTDAYQPAIVLIAGLYVAAAALMIFSRATFRPVALDLGRAAGSRLRGWQACRRRHILSATQRFFQRYFRLSGSRPALVATRRARLTAETPWQAEGRYFTSRWNHLEESRAGFAFPVAGEVPRHHPARR